MAKRENPIMRALKRVKQVATEVDSMAMERMPKDFQRMHNPKRKLLAMKEDKKDGV